MARGADDIFNRNRTWWIRARAAPTKCVLCHRAVDTDNPKFHPLVAKGDRRCASLVGCLRLLYLPGSLFIGWRFLVADGRGHHP